jgi:hypothetical protein
LFQLRYLDEHRAEITFRQPPPRIAPVASAPASPQVKHASAPVSPQVKHASHGSPSAHPHSQPVAAVPSDSLFVSDIPAGATQDSLQAHFSALGSPALVSRFNDAKRTAVVSFPEGGVAAARRAKAEARSLAGAPIRIFWNRPPPGIASGAKSTPVAAIADAPPPPAVRECPVCFEALEIKVALGCGHIICSRCSDLLSECPVCRDKISQRTRLFE